MKSILFAALALGFAYALSGCEAFRSEPESIATAGEVPAGVDVVISERDQVDEDPALFEGKTVLVEGTIDQFAGRNLFIVDYDGLLGMGTLPVFIGKEVQSMTATRGDKVRVIGDARMFVRSDLEKAGIDLDAGDSAYKDLENRLVIVAKEIHPVAEN